MGQFKFKSNRCLTLNIAEQTFKVGITTDFLGRLQEFGTRVQQIGKCLSEKEGGLAALKDACSSCEKAIDGLLGEGTSAKIFTGREQDVFDYLDVLNYLSTEVQGYFAARIK